MKILISKQHLKKFPKLSQYADEKVSKLEKFNSQVLTITVRLIEEKAHRGAEQDYSCELIFDMAGPNLILKDTERSLDKAIDKVVERAKKVLVKEKEKKLSAKHKEGLKNKS